MHFRRWDRFKKKKSEDFKSEIILLKELSCIYKNWVNKEFPDEEIILDTSLLLVNLYSLNNKINLVFR